MKRVGMKEEEIRHQDKTPMLNPYDPYDPRLYDPRHDPRLPDGFEEIRALNRAWRAKADAMKAEQEDLARRMAMTCVICGRSTWDDDTWGNKPDVYGQHWCMRGRCWLKIWWRHSGSIWAKLW